MHAQMLACLRIHRLSYEETFRRYGNYLDNPQKANQDTFSSRNSLAHSTSDLKGAMICFRACFSWSTFSSSGTWVIGCPWANSFNIVGNQHRFETEMLCSSKSIKISDSQIHFMCERARSLPSGTLYIVCHLCLHWLRWNGRNLPALTYHLHVLVLINLLLSTQVFTPLF